MYKFSLKLLLLTVLVLFVSACSEVEKSACQAFGNANSVLKSGRDVAFGVEPTPTATPTKDDGRY